jgi:hypothetical protein
MRCLFLLTPVAAISLSACAFQEVREYRIGAARSSDTAKLTHILHSVAQQVGLPQAGRDWYRSQNVRLSAVARGNNIQIELSRFDWPPPGSYTRAEGLLSVSLRDAFGHRLSISPPKVIEQVLVTE